jgi:HlyD family secretion protein
MTKCVSQVQPRLKYSTVVASKRLCRVAIVMALLLTPTTPTTPTAIGAEPQSVPVIRGSQERVTAGKPVRKTLTISTTQPGWIHAVEEAPLQARVTGYVKAVNVDIGDEVQASQVLMTIDAPELLDEVSQNEALVAQAVAGETQAQAAVAAANAAVRTAQAQMAGIEAGMTRADGELQRWKAEYDRINDLASRGTVTQKLVDETLNQLRATEAAKAEASAKIDSYAAAVEEAQANVQKAEADVVAAKAQIDVAKANLARAKTIAGYTEIKAPFKGIITQRSVDTGYSVSPNETNRSPLLVIARHDVVRVFTEVPELEAEWVTATNSKLDAVADTATVTIQGLNHRAFDASVTRTGWALDPKNRTLRTELDLDNREGTLRPGMYATVQIKLEERVNVLSLPVAAIVREGVNARCCAIVDGKIAYRPLKLGIRGGDDFEILSGIREDETIVLARAASLLEGQPVEILPPVTK